jgi:hypothetical protein
MLDRIETAITEVHPWGFSEMDGAAWDARHDALAVLDHLRGKEV